MTYKEDQFRDPGRLNTKIEVLEYAEPLDDFHGNAELTVVRECWGEWLPLRGDRLVVAQQQYGVVTSEVVVRYGQPLQTAKYIRRKRDGQLAAVAGAVPVDGGQRWLQLIVREIEHVGAE